MTWKQTTFELNHENPNYEMGKLCLDSISFGFCLPSSRCQRFYEFIVVHTIVFIAKVILESLPIELCNV